MLDLSRSSPSIVIVSSVSPPMCKILVFVAFRRRSAFSPSSLIISELLTKLVSTNAVSSAYRRFENRRPLKLTPLFVKSAFLSTC